MRIITKSEIEKILNNLVIIYDTREKEIEQLDAKGNRIVIRKNQHILDYLDNVGVEYKREKLTFGDYSYDIKGFPELSRKIVIERKASLDEISQNFGKHRDRFKREFDKAMQQGVQTYLIVENTSWTKVFNGKWRGALHPNAMIASLIAWEKKYSCPVHLIKKAEAGQLIYSLILFNLKKILEGLI